MGILKGVFIFMADLVRALEFPVEVDFVRLRSYGGSTESSGEVEITKDVELSLQDRHVHHRRYCRHGLTIAFLKKHLAAHQPASVKVCCLIDKRERREWKSPGLRGLCSGKGLSGGLRSGLRRTAAHLAGDFCAG